jgi:hypothetical protein
MSMRAASLFLLVVWVGPVTFAQTDAGQVLKYVPVNERPSSDSRVIPAGEALVLEPGTPLKLRLRDGSVVHGRFLGRTLLDSAIYVSRFQAHMRSKNDVPLALGETLQVALQDGREVRGAFDGYAELTLLLLLPDGTLLRVPFEFAKTIHRANGDGVDPQALSRAFRKGHLPSAEALVLGERLGNEDEAFDWANALRVPVEDIVSATAEFASASGGSGAGVAGAVVLGALLSVVLFYVMLAASFSSSSHSGCGEVQVPSSLVIRVTTRPFDRSRGCYADDPLAAAGSWPGSPPVATSQSLSGS